MNIAFIRQIKEDLRYSVAFAFACGFLAFLASAGCSIPNLESTECSEARTALREFYSFHFGNDMRFTAENLRLRKHFLTNEFYTELEIAPAGGDPFTTGDEDYPKAFRVGKCTIGRNGNPSFEVLLFWKDDKRSEQRSIWVEMQQQNGSWLVKGISKVKAND